MSILILILFLFFNYQLKINKRIELVYHRVFLVLPISFVLVQLNIPLKTTFSNRRKVKSTVHKLNEKKSSFGDDFRSFVNAEPVNV